MREFTFLIQGALPGKFSREYEEYGRATCIFVVAATPERGVELIQQRFPGIEIKVLEILELELPGERSDKEFVNA